VSASAAESAGPSESIEALKRLKASETEAEAKLHHLVEDGNERLKQLAQSAEESVRAAKVAAERASESAIERARTTLATDTAAVVKVGEADAAKVTTRSKSELAKLEAKLLEAVLGEFRSD
jgi:vacuolar-type H+-ATPase subunit H